MIEKILNKKKRGVVIIWAALLLMVLIGFIGMGIDMGLATLAANQMQVGADAAALAGAGKVRSGVTPAQIAAHDVAIENRAARKAIHLQYTEEANDFGKDIFVGNYDRATQTFTPQLTDRNAVQVVVRRNAGVGDGAVPLAFGPMFKVNAVNIERRAIAMVGGGTGAGLISLSPDDPKALYVRGNSTVTVNNGDIQVNSSSNNAVDLQGNLIVDAPNLNVVGDVNNGDPVSADLIGDTDINRGADSIDDPLLAIPAPTWNSASDLGTKKISTGSATIAPGYYSGGFSFSGGEITLEPGIYILGGVGLDVRGGTNLTGNGVMFYIDEGCASINGTGDIKLTPPTASTYEGLLIFQSRENDEASSINGTAGLDLSGSLYFPDAHVTLSGTSDKLGTQFVADTIEIAGNAELTINYTGKFPAPGNHIFLVR